MLFDALWASTFLLFFLFFVLSLDCCLFLFFLLFFADSISTFPRSASSPFLFFAIFGVRVRARLAHHGILLERSVSFRRMRMCLVAEILHGLFFLFRIHSSAGW